MSEPSTVSAAQLPFEAAKMGNGKPLVTLCQGGLGSVTAAGILQAARRNVVNRIGGCAAWSEAGIP